MVSIIIVNYNHKDFLKVCLRGIFLVKPSVDYEIIIIDNNSTDGSQEFLSQLNVDNGPSKIFKNVVINQSRLKIILNKKNIGFGAACNLGIKESRGEYILILNPDISVLEGSIEALVQYMEKNKRIGIIGPQLLNPNKTIQKSCFRYPKWYIPILRRTLFNKLPGAKKELARYLMSDFNHQEIREVDWLLGACLMLRKEMLEKIGFFDERFFLYFEDIDLCRRAKSSGWQVIYYPEAKMFHYHQRDSARFGIFSIFSRLTWIHIISGIKYFWKWNK